MARQIEQTTRIPMLTDRGNPSRPSWAADIMYTYNKEQRRGFGVKAEWELYQLSDRRTVIQLCYGHAGHIGRCAARVIDLEGKTVAERACARVFPGDSFDMDFSVGEPHSLHFVREGLEFSAGFDGEERVLHCLTPELELDLAFSDDCDALCTLMPYEKQKRFSCRTVKPFLDLRGRVEINGQAYPLYSDAFVLLDSVRGVLPGDVRCVHGGGSCEWGSHVFGITLGWGTGVRSAATENALFWDGAIHKLGRVKECPRFEDPTRPVKLLDEDGRLKLTFTPRYDDFIVSKNPLARARVHQVFGTAEGIVVLDDGRKLEVEDMPFFLTHGVNQFI